MTELVVVLPVSPSVRRRIGAHLVFIRRDPKTCRAYRIYANLFPEDTSLDQWGAPFSVLNDNIADLKNWMYTAQNFFAGECNEGSKNRSSR